MGCPSDLDLERFHCGEMTEADAQAVSVHVSSCAACAARVAQRQASLSQFVGDLKNAIAKGELGADETLLAKSPRTASRHSARLEISGYEIVRELHRGGQGVVYQAFEKATKRKVAIKVLLEGPYATDHSRRRFEREIELAASLKHSNIVPVFHSGLTEDGRQFCVMDYVRGIPLHQYVREQKLGLEDALNLFANVCEAVNYAHQKGVIHRDLKPSNILVDSDGTPKVLDFGLAKMVGGPEQTLVSMTGQVVGTLPYLSPEQARGNPDEIDIRTDVYSLGVVLYEMLTGNFPYPVVGQMADVLRHIAATEPTPPSRSWKADSGVTKRTSGRKLGACPIDDEVQTIVLRALTKERQRRYQSAADLGNDINHYLRGEPIEAKKDSALYVLSKQLRRYRGHLLVAVAFVLLLAGFAVTMMVQARRERNAKNDAIAARDAARIATSQAVAAQRAEMQQRLKYEVINEFIQTALQSSDPTQGGQQGMLVTDAMKNAVKLLDDKAFKGQPEVEADLRETVARILEGNAQAAEALPMVQGALVISRQLHAGDHENVASKLNGVARCLSALGRDAEALPNYEAALAMEERLYKCDHPNVAAGLIKVAGCLLKLGRSAEALPKCEAALKMNQRLFQGDNLDVATSLLSVATCLHGIGRSAEALPIYKEALDMFQRQLKGPHPAIITALNNFAGCLDSLGQSAEALPKFETALQMQQYLCKGDHPDVAARMSNMAGCLMSLGRFTEALPKFESALEMYRRLFKGDHPNVATCLNNVASCLDGLGRFEEALRVNEAALKMVQRLFKGDHPLVALGLYNEAAYLYDVGRKAEALPKFESALDMNRRLFKGDHPDVARCLIEVARCLNDLGRSAEALPKCEVALEMVQRLFKGDHPDVANCLNGLASCHHAAGRFADALPQYVAALQMRQRLYKGDNRGVATNLKDVAICVSALGRSAEALDYAKQGADMAARVLPNGHPKRKACDEGLAEIKKKLEAEGGIPVTMPTKTPP